MCQMIEERLTRRNLHDSGRIPRSHEGAPGNLTDGGTVGFCTSPAIRPSFALDYSSWHATHIVLVITTPGEGTFKVLESWKGDLQAGERLVIPELVPAPNAIPISRFPKSWWEAVRGGVSELIPSEPVGSRMVLFLNTGADEQSANEQNRQSRASRLEAF